MRPASVSIAGASHTNLAQNPLYIDVSSDPKHVYTAGEVVHGTVRVDPATRPQNVSIIFRGISILYDKNFVACKTELFRLEQELFTSGTGQSYDILRLGTAEDGKVELPFQFTFPQIASSTPPAERQWHHSKDSYGHPRFQHSPGFPLPPSCLTPMNVERALPPGVSYYLEARVDTALNTRQDVNFMPPAPEYDLLLLQPNLDFATSLPKQQCRYKFIRTRKLLPNAKERTKKLSRVKDYLVEKELFFGVGTFSEIPFYRFNVLATPPRVIVLGSSFPIPITLHHLSRSASIPSPPPLFLRRVRVQILCTYETFVPARLSPSSPAAPEHIARATRTTTLLDRRFTRGPGAPLTPGLDLASLGAIALPAGDDALVPSFSTYGLALGHELQVEMWGECVGNAWAGIVCKDRVQLVSGWTLSYVPEGEGGEGVLGLGMGMGMGMLLQEGVRPPQAFPPPEYETV